MVVKQIEAASVKLHTQVYNSTDTAMLYSQGEGLKESKSIIKDNVWDKGCKGFMV